MSHRSHRGVSADKDRQSPEISPSAEAQAVVGEISILRFYWVGGRTGCRLESQQQHSSPARSRLLGASLGTELGFAEEKSALPDAAFRGVSKKFS